MANAPLGTSETGDPLLLTPGPLTTSRAVKAAMVHDWGSRDAASLEINATVLKRLPAGEAYDIPMRCLLPQRTDRLIVAGRCISGTHEAHSSYRVMPIVMATGHAGGVCAALAARDGKSPRAVPVGLVQQELRRQGASLRKDLK